MTVQETLRALHRAIPGAREQREFEYTPGVSYEEIRHITPLPLWTRRILGQLAFACELKRDGSQDALLKGAMEYLLGRIKANGSLVEADALHAEQMLMPLAQEAKEYKLILAAHAHIDMNWLWGYPETVASTLDTFRTMLTLMDEYPDFHYSQSQASVYRIVEENDPEMMARIQQRIREGRWEVTAAAWVETDKNMPSTESLARHILYTKEYMHDTWGVPMEDIRVDFSPDTFGHGAYIPEIARTAGVPYYFQCRGYQENFGLENRTTLYRWRAKSGAEVLAYRDPYWYNTYITPVMGAGLPALAQAAGGLKTGLFVYGVGDHGGGPTRRDLNLACAMADWPIYPRIEFGTLGQFFDEAQAVRDRLPIVEQELNYVFAGCYTTQSRIKRGNRLGEALLYEGEAYTALAHARAPKGYPLQREKWDARWRDLLFTHFHDILTGSTVQDSREYAMGLYAKVHAFASSQRSIALRKLGAAIDTTAFKPYLQGCDEVSMGAGVGYGAAEGLVTTADTGCGMTRLFHVFNPLDHDRDEVVELRIWDWLGDARDIVALDEKGNTLPCQPLDMEPVNYWGHYYIRVLVRAQVPALGYATYALTEGEPDPRRYYYATARLDEPPYADIVLENDALRCVFSCKSGALISLFDKAAGQERVKAGETGGFRLVETQLKGASAWKIGRYVKEVPLDERIVITEISQGALRHSFRLEAKFMESTLEAYIYLDAGNAPLQMDVNVTWNEYSQAGGSVPLLRWAIPLAHAPDTFRFDVPAGVMEREPAHIDMPAHTFAAAVFGPHGLGLSADCKYGYRVADGALGVTLIHAPNGPDPFPERGVHTIRLGLFSAPSAPGALKAKAADFVHILNAMPALAQAGELPPKGAFLTLQGGQEVHLQALKPAQDGCGMVARLLNLGGKAQRISLRPAMGVARAALCSILEEPLADLPVENGAATVEIPAGQMVSVRLEH